MGNRILSCKVSMGSAMKFRDALEELLGLPAKTILCNKYAEECEGHTTILRYGNGYGRLRPEPEWSSRDFINEICIDKQQFVNEFSGLVPVPVFYRRGLPQKYPVLVRTTLTGAKSEGITLVNNLNEFRSAFGYGNVWTPYFHHEIELRVYVALAEKHYDYRIYGKYPRDGEKTENFVQGIGGADNTEWIHLSNSENPKVGRIVGNMAEKLYQVGGRFTGLDMIYVPELNDYVVLEANSGPWMTEKTCEWLARFFLEHQGDKFNWKGA